MNKKYLKQLEKMQSASQEEMQKNMEKLFRENLDLKAELKGLKKLADELDRAAGTAYVFTKSLSEIADNRGALEAAKQYIIKNYGADVNLTI